MSILINKTLNKTLLSTITSCCMLFSLSSISAKAASCGPGDHWIDSCVGNIDTVNEISGTFAVDFIGLGTFVIPVEGTAATISRSDSFESSDPGHFNQINTEILSATMTNIETIPGAGDFTVRLGVNNGVTTASTGSITEQADAALADSFFDIFFEVDSAIGTFHNVDPLRVTATIDEWNPDKGVFYEIDSSFGLPDVYNSAGLLVAHTVFIDNVSGFTIGQAVVPLPPAVYLFIAGLTGLAGLARRNKTIKV